jgi:Ca2+-binding EF-hand superfamily protein
MDNVMQIIKLMRQRLLTISNNNQEEYVLRNIFRTFDRDSTGNITLNELAGMLAHLQVYIEGDCL